jgi:phage-related protein
MTPNSFNVNSPAMNSYDLWGIKVINHDVFSPQKRESKQQIPFRHGSYDAGAKRYYNDRQLRLECQLTKRLGKGDFREIVYVLSQRSHLYFWDEPGKYYRGELYESVDVDVFPKQSGRNFTLPFRCDPFAYGPQINKKLYDGINEMEYGGTAEAPAFIIIRNPNDYPVSGIYITMVSKIT